MQRQVCCITIPYWNRAYPDQHPRVVGYRTNHGGGPGGSSYEEVQGNFPGPRRFLENWKAVVTVLGSGSRERSLLRLTHDLQLPGRLSLDTNLFQITLTTVIRGI